MHYPALDRVPNKKHRIAIDPAPHAHGQGLEAGGLVAWAMQEGMGAKADGVILLNRSGQIAFSDAGANAILSSGDGLTYRHGRFFTPRPCDTTRLGNLVLSAAQGSVAGGEAGGERFLIDRNNGSRPLLVTFRPAPGARAGEGESAIAALMLILELNFGRLLNKEAVSRVFGFSKREVELAAALAKHLRIKTAAREACMAVNTARNHLRGMYAKSGARNQIELFGILSRIV
jgi:DNA-binding CsgD family transcriptional regulator